MTESSEHKPGTPQGHGKARHVAASKKLGPGHVSHRGTPDVRTNMFLTFRFQDTPGTCDTVGHGSTYSDCSTYGLCATLRQRLEMAPGSGRDASFTSCIYRGLTSRQVGKVTGAM